jgi:hypothetical protein
MDREFLRTIVGFIAVFGLIVFGLHACSDAKDTAKKKLGPGAECVSSSDELAYCLYKGVGFICDKSNCIKAPSTPHTLLELDGDRQRQEDEDAAATATTTSTSP